MNRFSRHLLIVLFLVLTQVSLLAHAVGHASDEQEPGHPGGHVCLVCLAAHGLDTSLVSAPVVPEFLEARHETPVARLVSSASADRPAAKARDPPLA